MYEIKKYSYDKINELNENIGKDVYFIKPSIDKKIRVYKCNKLIAEVGDPNSKDYPTFLEENGKEFADKRRKAFYSRFQRLPNIKNGEIQPIFWSRWLLW
tara:strand:+ start:389 stop:688 length:300 start_codon:yes stop_codon:yes gene_type:complete